MKFFVGTMESGEDDWSACQAAIKSQSHKDMFHYVISGRTEQDAHRALYEMWNSVKNSFDLFLKIDADTVLRHDHVLSDIVDVFSNNPKLTGIQTYLHDYMTDSLIYGMACIRSSVTVNPNASKLYPDRVDSDHDLVIRGHQLPLSLDPAGNHCHHASEYQAFRFGVHRFLKNQHDIRTLVLNAWKNNGFDRVRGMALAGFALSSKCPESDYGDSTFHSIFLEAQKSYDEIIRGFK